MIPNMDGFANRLLKNWNMLSTFQMPLIYILSKNKTFTSCLLMDHQQQWAVGLGDGAGQLKVPGRHINFAHGRAGAGCACS